MAVTAIELHTTSINVSVPRNVCRVCHKVQDNLVSISNSLKGSSLTICELLVDYTELVVRSNDGGSSFICGQCVSELEVTVGFLRKCQLSGVTTHDSEAADSLLVDTFGNAAVAARHLCNLCGKHFKRKNTLKTHERRHMTHTPDGPGPGQGYTCDLCYKKYTTRANLLIHNRTHTGERPHECTECQKKFISRSTLAVHRRTHTGTRQSLCGECGRQVAAHKLGEHQRRHRSARSLQCPSCPSTFRECRALVQHAAVHAPGGAPARALCPRAGCRRRYRHPQSLGRHLRTCCAAPRVPPPAPPSPRTETPPPRSRP